MMEVSEQEYKFSRQANSPHTETIVNQETVYNEDREKLQELRNSITVERNSFYKEKKEKEDKLLRS